MNSIIERLQAFLTAARVAVTEAKVDNPTARGMAGIGWKRPDGSGMLVSDFDSEPFCDDLEAVLNAAIDLQRNHERRVIEAHLRGALAMRAACREVADESREAIDALPLPDFK